jgi:hypothetical protein
MPRLRQDGTARELTNDPGNIVAILNASAQLQDAYIFAGVDHPLRLRRNAASYFYEVDLAGSVRRLRDAQGNDQGGYRYTAFGQAFPADGTTLAPAISQPLQWKGRPFVNAAGGIYDMRARFWSPQMGAFLTIDQYAYQDANSTLWGWPGQSPVVGDPSGHFGVLGIVAGLVSGAVGGYITGGWQGAALGGLVGGWIGFATPEFSSEVGAALGTAFFGGLGSAAGQIAGNFASKKPLGTNFSVGAVAGAAIGTGAYNGAVACGVAMEGAGVGTAVAKAAGEGLASGVGEKAGQLSSGGGSQ